MCNHIETVRNFLKKYNIKNKPVIIGFSAGADSCFLTLILNELKQEFNLDITLAYFNHGWRKEAKDEEEFTINFAKKINAKYITAQAPKQIKKNEETARELRYRFFETAAKEYNIDTVLLAHNKNDNVETLVYRFIKGTSPKGLVGISENRDIYYRPILTIEKDEIHNYLKENGQEFTYDKSNSDNKYKRNFIRNNILPLFAQINENYLVNIDRLSKLSCAMKEIADDKINEVKGQIIKNKIINYDLYIALKESYRLEILNNFLGDKLKYRDYKTIKKLDDFILNNRYSKTSLNKEEFLRTRRDKIFIERKKDDK